MSCDSIFMWCSFCQAARPCRDYVAPCLVYCQVCIYENKTRWSCVADLSGQTLTIQHTPMRHSLHHQTSHLHPTPSIIHPSQKPFHHTPAVSHTQHLSEIASTPPCTPPPHTPAHPLPHPLHTPSFHTAVAAESMVLCLLYVLHIYYIHGVHSPNSPLAIISLQ